MVSGEWDSCSTANEHVSSKFTQSPLTLIANLGRLQLHPPDGLLPETTGFISMWVTRPDFLGRRNYGPLQPSLTFVLNILCLTLFNRRYDFGLKRAKLR